MRTYEYLPGTSISDLDTPALLIDLPALKQNLKTMHDFFNSTEAKLRPHVKLHKATPALAHMQMRAGNAIGVTCAKLSEAEIMAQVGIHDILIANQIVGDRKIQRLMKLATYSDVMVCVDSYKNIRNLSLAAINSGQQIRVLVEINIGLNRCGTEPLEPALELSKAVQGAAGLRFMGLMAYDGHCTMNVSANERDQCATKANKVLINTRRLLEKEGLQVSIVSAGGTFTYKYAAVMDGITEIQAGTYLLMDTTFQEKGVNDFACCLTVLGTVISRPTWSGAENLAVIDVGRKTMAPYYGFPEVKSPKDASVIKLSQEHGRILLEGDSKSLDIGDKVELWVRDANGTINLFDKFHVVQEGIVDAVWDIPLRGVAT